MGRVLIVGSIHRDTGNATAAELHWLLGRLRPAVVFLEHAATDLSTFLDGSCATLESRAVMRHREHHAVELVPVDLRLPLAELKPQVDEMFDRIEDANPRYCQLDLANRQHTEAGGFAYLNSPLCAVLQSEMRAEAQATVDAVGEPWLTDLYARWTQAHDLREMAMVSGVEAFGRANPFERGVLLVGAAHRQPILERSRLPRSGGSSPIAWDVDWHPDETDLEAAERLRGKTNDGDARS